MLGRSLVKSSRLPSLSLSVLVVFHSPASFALSDSIQSLSAGALTFTLASIGLIFIALSAAALMLHFKLKRKTNQVSTLMNNLSEQTEKSDRFISGIIHLDSFGNIIYANQMSAYYLARKVSDMLHVPFANCIHQVPLAEIERALSNDTETHIQCMLGARERNVRVRISPIKKPIDNVFFFVTFEDIDLYQQRIDHLDSVPPTQVCV